MKILFVTRKYPPSTGGMETAAYELYKALAATHEVTLVKWGGSNKMLPIVYPWLFIQAVVKAVQDRSQVIYLQDGVMAPMGWMLRLVTGRPTVITIHGKEATYANPIYKMLVPSFVRKQSRVVAVSNETKTQAQQAFPGLDPLVIFNGLSDKFYERSREVSLNTVAMALGMTVQDLQRYKILHTNGRLVRRKGVLWFVDKVMPKLTATGKPILYLVSGKGKDQELIEAAIAQHQLGDNVKLLGRVSDEVLRGLYNAADLFVMPNIPVANDMEGFGLVALEAASCGTPVVASKLEGIQDAITDGKNGILVTPTDAVAYAEVITRELTAPSLQAAAVRDYTLTTFAWTKVAEQYAAVMQQLISGK